ncbi:T9SS type A sorting domain-containing protein [Natronoflexus pectinivorans]|uniref:Putative secreted protein (Por secretion system target) n=1 Tax=Natronoflexus pectinivorans TaxID=682526 RepID=A0A4R2GI88_9BACT|nr:T9SS type A sorting domain-containing protein [Natronoflexus pectinivorans]TCO07920.1 putative secreted protein (Por secretion system target) [Natronoflexus pectinivorans]
MKKHLLFTVSVLFLFMLGNILTNAQFAQIPNHDFSEWEDKFLMSKPQGWHTEVAPEGVSSIQKSENAVDGNFSVEFTTVEDLKDEDDPFIGFAILGDFNEDGPIGSPWENTADKFHFSARYDVKENDAALAVVILYSDSDPIGVGFLEITGNSDAWETFEVPIDFTGGTPTAADAIFVAFLSSAIDVVYEIVGVTPGEYSPVVGSYLNVDQVYLTLGEDPTPISITNGSFEEWEDVFVYEPVGWGSYNLEVSDGLLPVTKFDEDGVSGVKITNVMSDWGDLVGVLFLQDNDFVRGVAYTADAPPAILISYKYEPTGAPEASLYVTFYGTRDGEEAEQGGGWFPLEPSEEFVQKGFQLHDFDNDFTPERLRINLWLGENNEGSVLYVSNLEFAEVYDITFRVNDQDTGSPVQWANIYIEGHQWPWQTGDNGIADIPLPIGNYNFTISAMGYNTYTGTINVTENDDVFVLMTPFVPDPNELFIDINDGDADNVYFEGDFFSANITLPPTDPAIPDNSELVFSVVLFSGPDTYFEASEVPNVFSDTPVVSKINGNAFSISGDIGNNDVTGVIGLKITGIMIDMGPGGMVEQPLPEPIVFPVFDTYEYAYYSQQGSDRGMAIVGVSIPDGDITSHPHFSQIHDLYNTDEGITFIREDHGSIYFPWLNIIDNRDQLAQLSDGLNISAAPNGQGFFVEVDLNILPFLQSHWVDVALGNIPEGTAVDDIMVVRTQFGETGSPASPEANNTDDFYLEDGVFSFRIHGGFSRYSLVIEDESVSVPNAELPSVSIFPNPFSNQISISSAEGIKEIRMTSINGQTLIQEHMDGKNSIATSHLPAGFYIVTLVLEDGSVINKPMIKK